MDLGLSHNQREASFFKDGCLSLRQAALEKQTSTRITPGPVYNPNVNSSSTTKNKTRNITFGSGPARFDGSSSAQDINDSRPSTPGPHEYCPKKILAATKGSPSRPISFGSATRACNAENPSSKLSPGPSEYDPESIRRGWSFTRRGSSAIKFGTAKPPSVNKKCKPGIGPQSYDPDAIRRGILLTRKSNIQSVTFGRPSTARSSRRPSSARQSSSDRPSSARGSRSGSIHQQYEEPGPQQYDTEAIRKGLFSLSTKRRPSGIVFTQGPRTYNDAEERSRRSSPGPNAYQSPSSLGAQVNSKYKSQPRISFGAR